MQIKIFHQVGFAGMRHGYKAGDLTRLVFEFDTPDGEAPGLETIFHTFNEGNDQLAADYRAKRLRSLSVGDVVTLGDTESYAVDHIGWVKLDEPMTDSHPLAEQAAFALTIVPERHREALRGCRIVTLHRIELPDGFTLADARRVAAAWDRLDLQQQRTLVGLKVDGLGDLSAI